MNVNPTKQTPSSTINQSCRLRPLNQSQITSRYSPICEPLSSVAAHRVALARMQNTYTPKVVQFQAIGRKYVRIDAQNRQIVLPAERYPHNRHNRNGNRGAATMALVTWQGNQALTTSSSFAVEVLPAVPSNRPKTIRPALVCNTLVTATRTCRLR